MEYAIIMSVLLVIVICFERYQERKEREAKYKVLGEKLKNQPPKKDSKKGES